MKAFYEKHLELTREEVADELGYEREVDDDTSK